MTLTEQELELLIESIYQSLLNDNLEDFKKQHNLDNRALENMTIALRQKINAQLFKQKQFRT